MDQPRDPDLRRPGSALVPPDPRGREGARPARDPAASMSLLNSLLANPLDAGYHAYSRESREAHLPLWRRLVLLLVAFALGLAATIAVRNLRAPGPGDVETNLLGQATSRQEVVLGLEDDVQGLAAEIRTAAAAVADPGSQAPPALRLAAADSGVTGPGITVTLTDGPAPAPDAQTGGVVRDQDIRMVVNALWGAGAEAIAVNGMRVGPSTFIRTAGSSVLVNVTAVRSPYRIEAVGDDNALTVSLVRGPTGDYLSTAKSVRAIGVGTESEDSLTLPGLDLTTSRHATPVDSK